MATYLLETRDHELAIKIQTKTRLTECIGIFAQWFISIISAKTQGSLSHYCSPSSPCLAIRPLLEPLSELRLVSKAWNTAIQFAFQGHGFFNRFEDVHYPYAWHINTRVREGCPFDRYRVYNTIISEDGDRGVYAAYDFQRGCSNACQVIVKAWVNPSDKACVAEDAAYQALSANKGPIRAAPDVLSRGFDAKCGVYIIALQKLGPSFDDSGCSLFYGNDVKISAVAIRLLEIYETIHSSGVVHNGIKPGNICFADDSAEDLSHLRIIDFDLSYPTPKQTPVQGDLYIPHVGIDSIGNRMFLSIFGHLGIEQSHRDDLESLGYLFSYLWHGSLPWSNHSGNTQLIWKMKMATSAAVLFAGMNRAFVEYWNRVKGLAFAEIPDYEGLREVFRACLAEGTC